MVWSVIRERWRWARVMADSPESRCAGLLPRKPLQDGFGARGSAVTTDAHAVSRLFLPRSVRRGFKAHQAWLGVRASALNTLGKLAFRASKAARGRAERCWETVVYIAIDDSHRKPRPCPVLAAVHARELSLCTALSRGRARRIRRALRHRRATRHWQRQRCKQQ